MTPLSHACVDLRTFSWRLLPLEQKLAWEREASLARLARAVAVLKEARQTLHTLERLQEQEASAVAASNRHGPDPHVHRHALHYLEALALRVRHALQQVRRGESALAQARAEFGACQRRTDTLLAARREALRAHVRAGLLRSDREADAAWLSHDQRVRADRGVSP